MRTVFENKNVVEDAIQAASMIDLLDEILSQACPVGGIGLSSEAVRGLSNVLALARGSIEDLIEVVPKPTVEKRLTEIAELDRQRKQCASGS